MALDPEPADGFVFWARNPRPFLPVLDQVAARHQPFVLQTTITGYPRAIDRHVPPSAPVIRTLVTIARDHGPEVVVWRYDPILLTDHLTAAWHRRNFAGLASRLAPLTDEVVVPFAHFYYKSTRHLSAAGIAWRDPPADEKHALLADLVKIAGDLAWH